MNSWFNHSQLPPGLVLADCIEFPSSAAKNIINNQSDFSIDHLVMSMCRVFSCVVGAVCLLWPEHSLRKTLLSFALFLFVLQGQSYLLLQVSLDFLLLHSHPLWWKGLFFAVSSRSCQRWQWQPTPVLLPGKSHKRRNLVGCSPWGREEPDMTKQLHFHFSLSCIGEGNGNPLQCSYLENPRDSRAWWAAIYRVTQSQVWLKWLSSSSSSS